MKICAKRTRKHKICAIETVRTFGKLNTYGDLTPKNIIAFDNWLHDGTRTDVTCYGYHKKIHKWVRQLYQMGEIPQDPYQVVTLKRGKCREREPLTELELKLMRNYKFEGKLARVRDLFIFAAYLRSVVLRHTDLRLREHDEEGGQDVLHRW